MKLFYLVQKKKFLPLNIFWKVSNYFFAFLTSGPEASEAGQRKRQFCKSLRFVIFMQNAVTEDLLSFLSRAKVRSEGQFVFCSLRFAIVGNSCRTILLWPASAYISACSPEAFLSAPAIPWPGVCPEFPLTSSHLFVFFSFTHSLLTFTHARVVRL